MDPVVSIDASTVQVMRLLYEGLLDCNDRLEIIPWLAAELPDVSDDKTVYTFRIREGVHFANGRELTAEDFVYSLERVLDPASISPGAGFLSNIKGAKDFQDARGEDAEDGVDRTERVAEPTHVEGLHALDRYTLRIELEKPDLAFLWILTAPYTYPVAREEVERWGTEYYRHPCGTGPFLLKEWKRDVRVRFERNPRYDGKARPGYDELEIMLGADDVTQTMMFERGELDLLLEVPQPDLIRLTRDPRWQPYLHGLDLQETDFLYMNCEMEPFDKKEVRQAVCCAVNRERLVHVLNGAGVPARGLVPPGVFGHDPERKGYSYDPDQARALLKQAGYADGLTVELWFFPDNSRWPKMAAAIQQDLRQVGIDVQLKSVTFSRFIDATARRGAVAFSLSGWTEDYPDASDFLGSLCDGSRITEEQCNNGSFYENERVDALIHEAAVATDAKRREALFREAEDLVMDDAPLCVLTHQRYYAINQPRVHGCTLHPVWYVRFEDLSLGEP